MTARPGAQRLAVTSGGAIPDRGLFSVWLATEKPSRVGELDEEMVYESRPGDVISLGATSWRITEITHDRVLVIPAPGQPARLPFWRGDDVGRPAELGRAIGAFTGELAALDRGAFEKRCAELGLNEYATENLWRLLDDQRSATAAVPTDTTLLVERFRDELGDWRVILHSPYGLRVHGPLALAVGRRLAERYGIDEKPTASDDGIVVRLPDTDAAGHRPARSCSSSTPTTSTRSSPTKWGFGTIRRAFSGMRGPCPAAAAATPRSPFAAVAPTPARRPAARRGPQIPRLSDRAGSDP
ncbi:DEAD/H associated family protein [Mycobacterium xenopi 3993]|nr:DEAD/H associated family protein [Mycobacterium xenopi 3993]